VNGFAAGMTDVSVSVITPDSVPASAPPLILKTLPEVKAIGDDCPRRGQLHIDLLLLAIEALDLGGSEAILDMVKELGLQDIIRNRVMLWQLRCTNPLRRNSQRRPLSLTETQALVVITGQLSRRLTVSIRQLLLAYQRLQEKQLSLEHHFRLFDYLERFRAHFRQRMNPKRLVVAAYHSDEKLNELALQLLGQLLLCTGTAGMQRLWVSLFDGEVA
jgi:hypothetical protein